MPDEQNLIVSKRNVLQIFRLEQSEEDLTSSVVQAEVEQEAPQGTSNGDDFFGAGMSILSSERQIVSKLVLLTEYHLYGRVNSICTVRSKSFDASGLEYILISFDSAKASLLRWDKDSNTVVTVSLHSFEREEYFSSLSCPSRGVMRIDPRSRVATLAIGGQYLAFMPIAQTDALQIDEQVDDLENKESPISKSFVLSTSQLEDDITQIIDFTFVDGYREPAIAILYSQEGTTTGLTNHWRKDTSKLVVLTLDIQAGARTAIFEITDLPANLLSLCMVPDPIGGCLVLGADEIIYIDTASRVVALGVNAYAKKGTDMAMRDYSHLNLRLEGSMLIPLLDGASLDGVLLVLADGRLGLLTLNLDGRTISSLHLKIVTNEFGGDMLTSGPSSATIMHGKRLFIGSRHGDSKLLAWRRKARAANGLVSGDQIIQDAILDVKDEEMDQNEALDDLYGDDITEKRLFGAETTTFDLRFYNHDSMLNQGPITGLVLGRPIAGMDENLLDVTDNHSDVAVVGGPGKAGNMTIYRTRIAPEIIGSFEAPNWQALWTVKVKSSTTSADTHMDDLYDTYMMASKASDTQVFTIETSFVEKIDSEFETSDPTLSVGTLVGETCIIQICADVMRLYDSDLKLLELKPTPDEHEIVSASIVDPYVLLLLDNLEVALYSSNKKTRELSEIDHHLNDGACYVSATLFKPQVKHTALAHLSNQAKHVNNKRKRDQEPNNTKNQITECLCFAIDRSGTLVVHQLPSLQEVFRSCALCTCPEILTNESAALRMDGDANISQKTNPAKRDLVEIVVAEIGQTSKTCYLVLRTLENDIICYQPFFNTSGEVSFSKVNPLGCPTRLLERGSISSEEITLSLCKPEMILCNDVAGHACVYLKQGSFWLLKTDQSMPTIHATGHAKVLSLSGFNTLDAPKGFIYCDEHSFVRICRFPSGFDFSNLWSRKVIHIGRSVHAITYHAPEQVYAILTSEDRPYELSDEEDEEWQPRQERREDLPLLAKGAVELIDSRTYKVIDRYELAENEQGMCLKALVLTIATQYAKKKRPCLAVSSGILRGEDLAMRGAVYVFDVVEVVPEPGQPDSRYRLKLVCREEVRAAATTLCEVDGYLLSSQGQKVVVRSLEEDERLTPVAFVDLGLATTTAKCLRSMVLFGDIQKGVRFVGFGEEPYKMTNFGRDYEHMDVVEAEFMVDGPSLYFVASDPEGNVRVLQYDPENPTTIAGTRLIRRSDMHVGHPISSMILIASSSAVPDDSTAEKTFVLCASSDGSLGAVCPISERSYRRLYTIQAQLASTEIQVAGLNPRAYRSCTVEGLTSNAAKGILDGQLLNSFRNLEAQAQTGLAQKSGVGVDNFLEDLGRLAGLLSAV